MELTTEQKRQTLRQLIHGSGDEGSILTLCGFIGEDGRTYSPDNPKDYANSKDAIIVVSRSREDYEAKHEARKRYYVWE